MTVFSLRLPLLLAAGLMLATASIAAGPATAPGPEARPVARIGLDPIWGGTGTPPGQPGTGNPFQAPPIQPAADEPAGTASNAEASPVPATVEPPPPPTPTPWAALASEPAPPATPPAAEAVPETAAPPPAAETASDAGSKPPAPEHAVTSDKASPAAPQATAPAVKTSEAVPDPKDVSQPPASDAQDPKRDQNASQTDVPAAEASTPPPDPAIPAESDAPMPPDTPVPDDAANAIVPLDTPGLPTHAFAMAVDGTKALSVLTSLQIEEEELTLRVRISNMHREMAQNAASIAEAAYKKRAADADKPLAVAFGSQVFKLDNPEADSRTDDPLGPADKPAGDGRAPRLIATPESGPVVLEVIGRGADLIATIQMPSGRLVIGRAGETLPDEAGQIASITPGRVEVRRGQTVKPLIFADELAR